MNTNTPPLETYVLTVAAQSASSSRSVFWCRVDFDRTSKSAAIIKANIVKKALIAEFKAMGSGTTLTFKLTGWEYKTGHHIDMEV